MRDLLLELRHPLQRAHYALVNGVRQRRVIDDAPSAVPYVLPQHLPPPIVLDKRVVESRFLGPLDEARALLRGYHVVEDDGEHPRAGYRDELFGYVLDDHSPVGGGGDLLLFTLEHDLFEKAVV